AAMILDVLVARRASLSFIFVPPRLSCQNEVVSLILVNPTASHAVKGALMWLCDAESNLSASLDPVLGGQREIRRRRDPRQRLLLRGRIDAMWLHPHQRCQ